jgi:peptide/nickel transport system substrate-binding protein
LDRLRSTSRTHQSIRRSLRILAASTVGLGLGVGGYFLFVAQADEPVLDAEPAPVETVSTVGSTTRVSESSSAAASEPQRNRGGTVRVGVIGDPGTLNLLHIEGDRSLLALQHAVGAAAIRLDPSTHDLKPGVVEEIPTLGNGGLTINADGSMTVGFAIASSARWSDGIRVTGNDFARTVEIVSAHREIIHPDVTDAYDRLVEGSLAITGTDVSFTVTAASLTFHELFAILLPAHQVTTENFATDWSDRLWASGGPFVVEGRSGRTVSLIVNPHYDKTDATGESLPYLDGLKMLLYASEQEAVTAFIDGRVDVVGAVSRPDLVSVLDAVDDAYLDIQRGPGWEHITFQFGDGATTVNPESVVDRRIIRKAIYDALDRQAIATAVQGPYGVPLDSITALGWPGGAASDTPWTDDDEPAGVLTGVTVIIATTGGDATRSIITNLVVDQLGDQGVTVVIQTDEAGRFFGDMVIPGTFEAAEWAWLSSPGPGGTAQDLVNWYTAVATDSLDFGQWSTNEDSLAFIGLATGLSSILSIDDLAERLAAAEAVLAHETPVMPLYADLNVGAATPNVAGYAHSALPGGVLSAAAYWWTPGE